MCTSSRTQSDANDDEDDDDDDHGDDDDDDHDDDDHDGWRIGSRITDHGSRMTDDG